MTRVPSKFKTTDEAIAILRGGGIIIYPTDTAFGIGCRIDNSVAVKRLFALRRRPVAQAMPVLVSSQRMAEQLLRSPSYIVRHLMKTYWPGGVTIVAPCKKSLIPSPVRGNGDTVGLRMPDHETALAIIRGVGVPITGSSANFHGEPTPYRPEDLDPELIALVDGVVDGTCPVQQASTVIDTTSFPPKILRRGAVRVGYTLAIDTSDSKATGVQLLFAGRNVRRMRARTERAQTVLPLIKKIIAEGHISFEDIADIRVHTGPGSFTGLRVGVAVAQALAGLLAVPVNGKPAGQTIAISYDDGGKFAMMDEQDV